jgi:hypothetical protein
MILGQYKDFMMVQLDYGQHISFLVIDNRLQMRVDWRWILFHIFLDDILHCCIVQDGFD